MNSYDSLPLPLREALTLSLFLSAYVYAMGLVRMARQGRRDVFPYAALTVGEKGQEAAALEELAPRVIAEERQIYKGVSANVDFYSGFVYDMLGIPVEMFTAFFAIARVVGWSAHRMEEVCHHDKIMRPAYMTVAPHHEYIPLPLRKDS